MSFGSNTPEALLPRSDSKNPATTCKGLTTAGRPCRRALAAGTVGSSDTTRGGVVAVLDRGDAAAFFCWQHKDQAQILMNKLSQRTRVVPLNSKSSIDTLIDRIGIIRLDDEVGHDVGIASSTEQRLPNKHWEQEKIKRRDVLPHEWQNIHGPLMSVPEDVEAVEENSRYNTTTKQRRRRQQSDRAGRSNLKVSWGCCVQADYEESPPPRIAKPRHKLSHERDRRHYESRRQSQGRVSDAKQSHELLNPRATPIQRQTADLHRFSDIHSGQVCYPNLDPLVEDIHVSTRRASKGIATNLSAHSKTAAFLSLIPSHLSPATTSAILAELSKPVSSSDEDGYIYVFWLTPESDVSKPDEDVASSLMDPDEFVERSSPHRSPRGFGAGQPKEDTRRLNRDALTSSALQRFASIRRGPHGPEKILLKIGRAGNVHRRLSQWTKQCGQNITLIRYYPYQCRSHDPMDALLVTQSSSYVRRKAPHIHRVERLVHLELSDQRVTDKGKCDQCGREHREWFEVEATTQGVRAVDEVIRRWVGWAETVNIESSSI